jgi:transcriptional regulator with XRE-family HTH domain
MTVDSIHKRRWSDQVELSKLKGSGDDDPYSMGSEELKQYLANRVDFLLKEANLNQTDFSKISGINNTTISRMLNRKGHFDISTCMQVAKAFGLTVDELLGLRKPDRISFEIYLDNPVIRHSINKMRELGITLDTYDQQCLEVFLQTRIDRYMAEHCVKEELVALSAD